MIEKTIELNEREASLAKRVGFDKEILKTVKHVTQGEIRQLTRNIDGEEMDIEGICVAVPAETSYEVFGKLRQALKSKGYLAFLAEVNFGQASDKIGVICSDDHYDILRISATESLKNNISNEDIIEQLKEWEKICSFDIIGADYDWVQAVFVKQPDDMAAFAEEVYDFCPDVVEQGTETVEALAQEMKQSNTLYMWWN